MTLLITEVHPRADDPFIVFAADRRITGLRDGEHRSSKCTKLVPVPHLDGALGFYGIADLGQHSMDAWLRRFVQRQVGVASLREFADVLARDLTAAIPVVSMKDISGIHLAGFNRDRKPEFWIVRNCDPELDRSPCGTYSAREDFQRRDAAQLSLDAYASYQNGDLRPYAAAWSALDTSLGTLRGAPDFLAPRSPADHLEWLKFKMDVTVMFYRRFHPRPVIGGHVDAFLLRPGGVRQHASWRVDEHRRDPARSASQKRRT